MDVSPSGNCSQEFVHYGDKIPACTFLFCPFMVCVFSFLVFFVFPGFLVINPDFALPGPDFALPGPDLFYH